MGDNQGRKMEPFLPSLARAEHPVVIALLALASNPHDILHRVAFIYLLGLSFPLYD